MTQNPYDPQAAASLVSGGYFPGQVPGTQASSAPAQRLVAMEEEPEEKMIEAALRPKSLDDFVGQRRVRQQLSLVLEASKMRGRSADHVLLSGPPGLGKTTLAMIIAAEMEAPLRITSGPAIQHSGDLAAILSSLTPGEVLFLDEIHRMSRPAEEMLYMAMEDFRVDIVVGKGAGATSIPLELPQFTLVGATTRAGLLPGPLRDRFGFTGHLEFYSVMRSVRAIEHSDVCLLLVDATRGFEGQDANIFWLAQRNKKGVVILVNKWDLVEKDTHTTKHFEEGIRKIIAPFTDVPIIFISALTKQRIYKAIEKAVEVYNNRSQRIKTSVLNEYMLPIIEATPPPATKGKYIKIKYCMQLPTDLPQFVFFANLPQYIKDPYRRFVENKLREKFNFEGVPLDIFFREK